MKGSGKGGLFMMQSLFKTDNVFAYLVEEVTAYIDEQVIITNEAGIIVASSERSRIGNYHEGAYLAMKNQQKMIMTEEMCRRLKGVRKGIVLPITIEGKPIGVLGITGDPLKVELYGRIVQRMAELFINETINQMTQEKKARNLELFVFDWINDNMETEHLIERSNFFNIDLHKYEQIICLQIPAPIDHLSFKDILLLKRIWDSSEDALFARLGQGRLIIIDTGYRKEELYDKLVYFLEDTESELGKEVHVGVGKVTDYLDLRTSYEQAERACFIANSERRIVFEEDLQFEMLQYSISPEVKEKFIKRTIAPILSDDVLMNTLYAWLKNNLSINETAKALYIHKNTLYYRLKKIEEKTKGDLKNTDHVVLLYLGMKFFEEKTAK